MDDNVDFKKKIKQAKLLVNLGILIAIVGGLSAIMVTLLYLFGVIEG